MSPTQTSGRDSFGWRLRCPFSLSADLRGGAEDSYGIEDRSSSKIKSKAASAEKAAGEAENRHESCRARQGRAGETGDEACREANGRRSAGRQAQSRQRQAAGEQ